MAREAYRSSASHGHRVIRTSNLGACPPRSVIPSVDPLALFRSGTSTLTSWPPPVAKNPTAVGPHTGTRASRVGSDLRRAGQRGGPLAPSLSPSPQKLCTRLSTARERLFTPREQGPGSGFGRCEGRRQRLVIPLERRRSTSRKRPRSVAAAFSRLRGKFNRSAWNPHGPGASTVVARYVGRHVSRETLAQLAGQTNGRWKHGHQSSLQPHRRKRMGSNPRSYPPRYPQRYPPVVHSVAPPPTVMRNTLKPPKGPFRDSVEPNPNGRITVFRRPPANDLQHPSHPTQTGRAASRTGGDADR
jgi:hypothetical protein